LLTELLGERVVGVAVIDEWSRVRRCSVATEFSKLLRVDRIEMSAAVAATDRCRR
jgi:hypothetical protein